VLTDLLLIALDWIRSSFGSASDLTKSEASEAMHALAAGNKENVLSLVTQTTSWLAKTPLAAQEAAGTMALQVIHHTLSCCPLSTG
jgi:hypothetical protein